MKNLRKFPMLCRKTGPDKNTCNICKQEVDKLSEDHVPPHAVQTIMAVSVEPNAVNSESCKGTFSQDGVKFRTVCTECNNKLGYEYDNKLSLFIEEARYIYEEESVLTSSKGQVRTINAPVADIIRSLCGHLVAAKIRIDDVVMDGVIRDFLFDKSKRIPENINIFYWPYPYDEVRIQRDFGSFADIKNPAVGSIMKFYPMAFFFTDSKKFMGLPNLRECIGSDGNNGIIPLSTSIAHPKHWPEGDKELGLAAAFLGGQAASECIRGKYRPPKRK